MHCCIPHMHFAQQERGSHGLTACPRAPPARARLCALGRARARCLCRALNACASAGRRPRAPPRTPLALHAWPRTFGDGASQRARRASFPHAHARLYLVFHQNASRVTAARARARAPAAIDSPVCRVRKSLDQGRSRPESLRNEVPGRGSGRKLAQCAEERIRILWS